MAGCAVTIRHGSAPISSRVSLWEHISFPLGWEMLRWPICLPKQDYTRASFGGLVFWLFCSSRHTVITVTSAISLLVGASLGEIAGGDTTRFSALAAATAILVALIAFIAWLAKAGSIVNFISESVMIGFKCGVACFLASTQLPKLFGIHGAHGNFWENSATSSSTSTKPILPR